MPSTYNLSGHLYNNAGVPIAGAKVNLFKKNTTTSAGGSSATTDTSGYYTISPGSTLSEQAQVDVRVTNAATGAVRRIKYDDVTAQKAVVVRNVHLSPDSNQVNSSGGFHTTLAATALQGASHTVTFPMLTGGALVTATPQSSAGAITLSSAEAVVSSGAITGTALRGTTSLQLATGATVTGIDDGTIGTSSTLLATQGAIKTYVDAQIGTEDTIAELNDTNISSPAAGHILVYDNTASVWDNVALSGGTGLTATLGDGTLALAIDSTVATLSGVQTLTDKTLTAPTLTTPALGTPASGVMTNMTGLVNAGVSASAAIAYSKLAALADGNILVGNGSNVAVSVNPSGAVDISNAGVFSIANDAIDSTHYAAGSIDTEHIADDQITNALMADDAIGVAQLSATGTASSGTFLRGDNSWAATAAAYTDSDAISAVEDEATLDLGGAVTIAGNLTVNGTTTTIDTATLAVEDPLIALATGNGADSVDVGLYAKYTDSGVKYSGLFRDASDSDKWKLFATTGGSHAAPTTTVNTTSGFTLGTLVASAFEGDLTGDVTGNADTVTTNANLTGHITSSGSNATLLGSFTQAQLMAALGTNTILVDADIGSTVQAYDADLLALAGIGTAVQGDIIYSDSNGSWARLVEGTDGHVLTLASGVPSWAASTVGDITNVIAGAGMTGGATSGEATLNVIGGTGITANADDIAVTEAQTGITSVYNAALKIGRDTHNQFDFATDNAIKVSVNAVDDEFRFVAGGNFHADADVFAYSDTTASDRNIKKNIVEISEALDKVKALHGVTFDYKEEHRGSSVGLIAQDVQALYPELVKLAPKLGTDDETYLSLNYNGVIGLLVEAVKELAEKVGD